MTQNKDEIQQELRAVLAYVRDCQARANKGEVMDVQGLDKTVERLCANALALPPDEAADLQDSMRALIVGLDDLAAVMRERHALAAAAPDGAEK